MIKVYIFNKINNVLRVYVFKKFFQCISSEISLMHCTEMSAVYQNMLNSQRRLTSLTFRLIFSLQKIRVHESGMTNTKTIDNNCVVTTN